MTLLSRLSPFAFFRRKAKLAAEAASAFWWLLRTIFMLRHGWRLLVKLSRFVRFVFHVRRKFGL